MIAGLGWLWLRRQPPQERTRAGVKLAFLLIMLGLLFLAITGRLHWLGALVALLLPLAQRIVPLLLRLLPWIQRGAQSYKSRQSSSGGRSQVRSRMIAMSLAHDSGSMDGEVLEGSLCGRQLSSLSKEEFLQLLRECRDSDRDSTRLLETYLDKRFGAAWRADDPGGTGSKDEGGPRDGPSMTREEALAILGLEPGADRVAIIEAHRRLIQRNHPDRGGSTWLASRINEAKTLLLRD
nr:molecular chaperone DnaJ [Marinobacterium ramblicola]